MYISGLGTSSILAATILAALWTLMGISFNTNNIHHAVRRFLFFLYRGVVNYGIEVLLMGV